jgi:hypothetical protein
MEVIMSAPGPGLMWPCLRILLYVVRDAIAVELIGVVRDAIVVEPIGVIGDRAVPLPHFLPSAVFPILRKKEDFRTLEKTNPRDLENEVIFQPLILSAFWRVTC